MNSDDWVTNVEATLSQDVLRTLQQVIENESALVVEHRFYKGSRSPNRFICDDFSELETYLHQHKSPGDAFYFWVFQKCCTDDNFACFGKVPNSMGQVPKGGAY